MELSGGPVKRSFQPSARQYANTATHVCFFCGQIIHVAAEYQKHIVEHQQVSIAYQIYAQEHPPRGRGEREREGKEKEEEQGGRKRSKGMKGEPVEEKRPRQEYSSFDTSFNTSSLPSPPAPIGHRTQTHFAVPSHPAKAPVLQQGRYPASKQQGQHTTGAAGAEEGASEGQQQPPPMRQLNEAHCVVCTVRFQNATELLMHNIREHDATILKIQVVHHYGETAIMPANSQFEYTAECEYCRTPTANLTESFEHAIAHHKGHLMRGTDADAVTYNLTCGVPSKMNFEVRIRLRKAQPKE